MKEIEEEKGKVVQKFGHPITSSHTPCQCVCVKNSCRRKIPYLLFEKAYLRMINQNISDFKIAYNKVTSSYTMAKQTYFPKIFSKYAIFIKCLGKCNIKK